ncbi:unnamed protein product, partial [Trichogramma brassicae]
SGVIQLHPVDIEETRKLANVSIYVERVIGRLKNKFKILSVKVPLGNIMFKDIIDKSAFGEVKQEYWSEFIKGYTLTDLIFNQSIKSQFPLNELGKIKITYQKRLWNCTRDALAVCRALRTQGTFLDTAMDSMQLILKKVDKWCSETGLTVNPAKTELVIFTRKHRVEQCVNLTLRGITGSFVDICLPSSGTIDKAAYYQLPPQSPTLLITAVTLPSDASTVKLLYHSHPSMWAKRYVLKVSLRYRACKSRGRSFHSLAVCTKNALCRLLVAAHGIFNSRWDRRSDPGASRLHEKDGSEAVYEVIESTSSISCEEMEKNENDENREVSEATTQRRKCIHQKALEGVRTHRSSYTHTNPSQKKSEIPGHRTGRPFQIQRPPSSQTSSQNFFTPTHKFKRYSQNFAAPKSLPPVAMASLASLIIRPCRAGFSSRSRFKLDYLCSVFGQKKCSGTRLFRSLNSSSGTNGCKFSRGLKRLLTAQLRASISRHRGVIRHRLCLAPTRAPNPAQTSPGPATKKPKKKEQSRRKNRVNEVPLSSSATGTPETVRRDPSASDVNNNDVDNWQKVRSKRQKGKGKQKTVAPPKSRKKVPAKRPRPDVVVIKAKDPKSYASILQRLRTEQALQDPVGSNVNRIRRSATGDLLLELRKASGDAKQMCRALDEALGELATTRARPRVSLVEIRDLDEAAHKR